MPKYIYATLTFIIEVLCLVTYVLYNGKVGGTNVWQKYMDNDFGEKKFGE